MAKQLARIFKACLASTYLFFLYQWVDNFYNNDLYRQSLTVAFLVPLDPSKVLPTHIKVKSSRRDEDDEFDGSGSENELVDIESEPEPDLDDEDIEDEVDQDADNAFLE